MFSEYTSKLLSQSQARLPGLRSNPAPLFLSTQDYLNTDESADQMAPRSIYAPSRSRFQSAFAKKGRLSGDDHYDDDDDDYDDDNDPSRSLIEEPMHDDADDDDDEDNDPNTLGLDSSIHTVVSNQSIPDNEIPDLDIEARPLWSSWTHQDDDDDNSLNDNDDPPSADIYGSLAQDNQDDLTKYSNNGMMESVPLGSTIANATVPPASSSRANRKRFSPSIPPQLSISTTKTPKFDRPWALLYSGLMIFMLSSAFLTWIRTEPAESRIRDAIFLVISQSIRLLSVDMVLAFLVSLVWFYVITHHLRPLVYTLAICLPLALVPLCFTTWAFSFKSPNGGHSTQDNVMRLISILPLVFAVLWSYVLYHSRNNLNRAIRIIQLSCKILKQNSSLMALGVGIILAFTLFTFAWIQMFSRAFLAVSDIPDSSKSRADVILAPRSWLSGMFYVFMYLWTFAVFSGIQRVATSSTVAQWYFYRHCVPPVPARIVLVTSLFHAVTTLIGSVCFSSFTSLMLRIPLLILPKRLSNGIQLLFYQILPISVVAITHPLTLSFSAITMTNLSHSARVLATQGHVDFGKNVIGSRFHRFNPTWGPYRLAKLILMAARILTALILGFMAWIRAEYLASGAYAYTVAILASFIGYTVLGATEGALSMVVDSAYICHAVDQKNGGGHCAEADRVFVS
ncbi:hypothetical protein CANCADRAFT_55741 [Tortispora caseinolytica NRRL Y-17796]|uniref:Protein PNS1 n=1 Tax=Tortispora caseinolytica NRRL Y-17796 TaxID=767744 RepID=A0A1E4TJQ5_9ASCO|nr:hypothetical protein CANCADRAFT_55741 [Tortispora caseinolytica NRRL Y-17796]